jgi:hypothetical protein
MRLRGDGAGSTGASVSAAEAERIDGVRTGIGIGAVWA